jgi:peptidoglycan/LPS O-acetylase OafA/YrhL
LSTDLRASSPEPAAAFDAFDAYRRTKVFSALNGIRALCALGVIQWHTWEEIPKLRFLTHGYLGVDVFFTVSGFLIVTLLLRERDRCGDISLRQFYARRTLRIFPIYYLLIFLVLFAFLLVYPWKPGGLRFYLPVAAVLVTYTTDIIIVPALGIFYHFWSLAVEEQFYMIWPTVEKYLTAPVKWVLLLAGLVVNQMLHYGVFTEAINRLYGRPDAHRLPIYLKTFTPIILGVIIAHLLHHRRSFNVLYRLVGWRWSALTILAVVFLVLQREPKELVGIPMSAMHLAVALGVAAMVIREDHGLQRILTFGPLARIGAISYGVYVYHTLIIDLLYKGSHGRMAGPALFVVASVLSILTAEISFRFYESRFLNLRERFQPKATPVTQTRRGPLEGGSVEAPS